MPGVYYLLRFKVEYILHPITCEILTFFYSHNIRI